MIDRTSISTFQSFQDADDAANKERWAMTYRERLVALEMLRKYRYPDGRATPRLQRLLESVKFPQS